MSTKRRTHRRWFACRPFVLAGLFVVAGIPMPAAIQSDVALLSHEDPIPGRSAVAALAIRVIPPWWGSLWFRGIALVGDPRGRFLRILAARCARADRG